MDRLQSAVAEDIGQVIQDSRQGRVRRVFQLRVAFVDRFSQRRMGKGFGIFAVQGIADRFHYPFQSGLRFGVQLVDFTQFALEFDERFPEFGQFILHESWFSIFGFRCSAGMDQF